MQKKGNNINLIKSKCLDKNILLYTFTSVFTLRLCEIQCDIEVNIVSLG